MFQRNLGPIDRGLRALAGLVLVAAAVFGDGMAWGWIGLIPLATSVVGYCPAYRLFGWSSCRTPPQRPRIAPMERVRALVAAALLLPLAAPAAGDGALLTILTSPARDTQAMALILTRQAHAAGAEARVLLCDAAGDLALRGAPAVGVAVQPPGLSPAEMLRGLQADGVTVEVCAIYLPNRSVGAADLDEGIGVASPRAIGALVADPAVRLFTF